MTTLAHKGLVESSAGPDDRRTTVLSLTSSGITAARKVGEIEQTSTKPWAACSATSKWPPRYPSYAHLSPTFRPDKHFNDASPDDPK